MNNRDRKNPAADDKQLSLARQLVSALESGDEDGASDVISAITRMHEDSLFRQIGKLTRQLHETLNNFKPEPRVTLLADKEIPDAKERLDHVITLTAEAADRTLGAVEKCLPLTEALAARARSLREAGSDARGRDELAEFLEFVGGSCEHLQDNLKEILLAQEFQDLTGQVIRRVISLVQEVQESLVGVIRASGDRQQRGQVEERVTQRRVVGSECFGPAVPGIDGAGAVGSQDEVDDLLASLGF
jgi:chemotaxis protein CheZ